MFLGDVSTTSTNIYFVLGLLNVIIFSFQVHVTEFILFTFFGDISPICTTDGLKSSGNVVKRCIYNVN